MTNPPQHPATTNVFERARPCGWRVVRSHVAFEALRPSSKSVVTADRSKV